MVADPAFGYLIGTHADSGITAIVFLIFGSIFAVTENRTSWSRQAPTTPAL